MIIEHRRHFSKINKMFIKMSTVFIQISGANIHECHWYEQVVQTSSKKYQCTKFFLNKMNTLYQYCHVCILNKSALRATFIAGHLCEGDLTKYHDTSRRFLVRKWLSLFLFRRIRLRTNALNLQPGLAISFLRSNSVLSIFCSVQYTVLFVLVYKLNRLNRAISRDYGRQFEIQSIR